MRHFVPMKLYQDVQNFTGEYKAIDPQSFIPVTKYTISQPILVILLVKCLGEKPKEQCLMKN